MNKFTRIKGDNKPQNVIRLPELGRIRLGIKLKTAQGKEYPKETDYFVCPPEVIKAHGDKPKSLPVMLPVENEEMFMRQFYATYGSNQKLKCIGNGEVCERRKEDNTKEELPCPSPAECDYGKTNKCHARIVLQVVLPAVNVGGVYQLSSGSINSDIDIRSGIEMARHLFGRISYVPMILQRQEKKIPDPATGKMQTHWTVKLFPFADLVQAAYLREDTKRILAHQEHIALPEMTIEGKLADTPTELIDEEKTPDYIPPGETKTKLIKKYDKGQAVLCPERVGKQNKLRPREDCDCCETTKEKCSAWE